MAIFPRRKATVNCLRCKYYRPSDTIDFVGNCIRTAPVGTANNVAETVPGGRFSALNEPGIIWCGDFEKWEGAARPCGTPVGPLAKLLSIDGELSQIATTEERKAIAGGELSGVESVRKNQLLMERKAVIEGWISTEKDVKTKNAIALQFHSPVKSPTLKREEV
jgi:hypothetical protein